MSKIIGDFWQLSCEAHGIVSVVTWAKFSRCVPSVGVESWLPLTRQWKGLTRKPIGCEDWPWLQWRRWLCRGWPYRAGFPLTVLWDLLSLPYGCVLHWGGWIIFSYGQKLVTGYIGSGASCGELWCRPRSAIACILGSLGMGYRVICAYPLKS